MGGGQEQPGSLLSDIGVVLADHAGAHCDPGPHVHLLENKYASCYHPTSDTVKKRSGESSVTIFFTLVAIPQLAECNKGAQ